MESFHFFTIRIPLLSTSSFACFDGPQHQSNTGTQRLIKRRTLCVHTRGEPPETEAPSPSKSKKYANWWTSPECVRGIGKQTKTTLEVETLLASLRFQRFETDPVSDGCKENDELWRGKELHLRIWRRGRPKEIPQHINENAALQGLCVNGNHSKVRGKETYWAKSPITVLLSSALKANYQFK